MTQVEVEVTEKGIITPTPLGKQGFAVGISGTSTHGGPPPSGTFYARSAKKNLERLAKHAHRFEAERLRHPPSFIVTGETVMMATGIEPVIDPLTIRMERWISSFNDDKLTISNFLQVGKSVGGEIGNLISVVRSCGKSEAQVDKVCQLIFMVIDNQFDDGRFEEVDYFLEKIEPADYPPDVPFAILTISRGGRDRLVSRPGFVERTERHFLSFMEQARVQRLLKGLR